ncbi:stimulated by retinoic acid protein 6 -like protein [Brachionus plicatilis]|uniref:Stimulated by retinoic acid protein 6-like protein n=1 Tax=Brachionus plicatilis TaxID=10195 RepID=A0A3M7R3A7_BRAPC|nr:stimulated by retinoic acid protein 6 -like protein [Brachionus plicatilis]
MAFFLVIIFFPFLLSVISFRLMNRLMVSMATRFCFRSDNNFLTIKSLKMYSIFLYFKFFYDCFTGIALCFARMIKSLALSIIFLPRLDYSFMGRNMEKMDTAFMAYIGYLHWESKHTNAIVISFCKLMLKTRKNKIRIIGSESFTRARNKWQLLFMLHKNPILKKSIFKKNALG